MANDRDSNYWTNKRLPRRTMLRGAAVGIVGLGLAGCTTSTSTPTAVPPAPTTGAAAPTVAAALPSATAVPVVAQPKLGGKISTIATLNEAGQDPHATNGAAGGVGLSVCYSQMMTYKWAADIKASSYIPTGDLVESWTTPDDTTFIFKLRPNVKFHNIAPVSGRVLDADDVRVAFDRIIAKKAGAANLANLIKTEAVDKTTVKVTLDKPNADFLANLANANSTEITAKELADKDLIDGPTIGTGAWVFDAFEKGSRVATKKNPDYYVKGVPYADAWESFRATDPAQPVNAFRAGNVNVIGSGMTAASGAEALKGVPKAIVVDVPLTINPNYFSLNAKSDTFKDKRVRQAISKAIDHKAVIDTIFLGKGGLNAGLLMPDPAWYIPDAELQKLQARDLEGAKALLKAAGKEGLVFEAITTTYLQNAYVDMAALAQANLKDIGVTMNIKSVDPTTHVQLQTTGNFTAVFGAYAGGFPNFVLNNRYYSTSQTNYAGSSDPALDKMIEAQAVLVRDPDKRKSILQDIQRFIIDDAVHITLSVYQQPTIAQPEVRNFYPPVGVNSHNLFWSTLWLDK